MGKYSELYHSVDVLLAAMEIDLEEMERIIDFIFQELSNNSSIFSVDISMNQNIGFSMLIESPILNLEEIKEIVFNLLKNEYKMHPLEVIIL